MSQRQRSSKIGASSNSPILTCALVIVVWDTRNVVEMKGKMRCLEDVAVEAWNTELIAEQRRDTVTFRCGIALACEHAEQHAIVLFRAKMKCDQKWSVTKKIRAKMKCDKKIKIYAGSESVNRVKSGEVEVKRKKNVLASHVKQ